MNWWKRLKGKVRRAEPLRRHTTFKIGGPAEYLVEPYDISDLRLLLSCAKKYRFPFSIIGLGSNILVNDKGVEGAVLRLSSPFFRKISFRGNRVSAGAGTRLSRLLLAGQKQGLGGLEFLAGIPATLGGALAMNAGAAGKGIADLVEKATVMDYNGNIKILNKDNIGFDYRKSNLSRCIILNAQLRLKKDNSKKIKKTISECLDYRRESQDLSFPSAGCIFKNPKGRPAGMLIDLCGLKRKRIGDACVSDRHANFILNRGHSSARDVLRLMDLIRKEIRKKFRITLEPEIKIWQ